MQKEIADVNGLLADLPLF